MNNHLYIKLPSGSNYGWGICGFYLKKEISAKINTTFLDENCQDKKILGKLFQAISNIDFFDINITSGLENYGYTFFENEPNNITIENSKKYNLIFCGSSWCQETLGDYGINNSALLIQGIDPDIFYPIEEEKDNDKFVIFSGGKFEFRKGQDLVLKAFKILREKYKDIYLINSWNNMWPETMKTMYMSEHINFTHQGSSWLEIMNNNYLLNGLDPEYIHTYKVIPFKKERQIYQRTDIAVFPNRCEGGTNLVMMEYMACGKPVIASYTSGHKDILTKENSLMLTNLKNIEMNNPEGRAIARWQEASLDELVNKIEYAYHHRSEIKKIGIKAGNDLKNFTWKKSAEDVIKTIF